MYWAIFEFVIFKVIWGPFDGVVSKLVSKGNVCFFNDLNDHTNYSCQAKQSVKTHRPLILIQQGFLMIVVTQSVSPCTRFGLTSGSQDKQMYIQHDVNMWGIHPAPR